MSHNLFHFIGGQSGPWQIARMNTIRGEPLEPVSYLNILPSNGATSNNGLWMLKGFTSNIRYAEKTEKDQLTAIQAELGRPAATCAALIPIRKSPDWWTLAQDERRAIFETQSHHTQTGLQYLPAIARKLYHCRDIGEPFDFLTWFEYAPADAEAFESLVATLHQTQEWTYVNREVDIRLIKV
jgi:chlorite dismutase